MSVKTMSESDVKEVLVRAAKRIRMMMAANHTESLLIQEIAAVVEHMPPQQLRYLLLQVLPDLSARDTR